MGLGGADADHLRARLDNSLRTSVKLNEEVGKLKRRVEDLELEKATMKAMFELERQKQKQSSSDELQALREATQAMKNMTEEKVSLSLYNQLWEQLTEAKVKLALELSYPSPKRQRLNEGPTATNVCSTVL